MARTVHLQVQQGSLLRTLSQTKHLVLIHKMLQTRVGAKIIHQNLIKDVRILWMMTVTYYLAESHWGSRPSLCFTLAHNLWNPLALNAQNLTDLHRFFKTGGVSQYRYRRDFQRKTALNTSDSHIFSDRRLTLWVTRRIQLRFSQIY